MIEVLDKGLVRLEYSVGDDLSVINAAKVSFAKRSRKFEKAEEGLLKYLMKNRHGSPFEHNSFTFFVKAPIFVAREWFRHRIASYNEMSMRYHIPDELEFYIPAHADYRTQVGKPGAYNFEHLDGGQFFEDQLNYIYEQSNIAYNRLLAADVAKEMARIVLPVATYTQFFFTVNARALMNFLSLRNADDAMFEIREYAKAIESLWAEKMPVTHQAFVESGRLAP